MKNRHGKKADQHDRSHFYPVTKEPTTPSQDAPRKRKTRHSQNPPQVCKKEYIHMYHNFSFHQKGFLGFREVLVYM